MNQFISIRNQSCPNESCSFYGKFFAGNIVMHGLSPLRMKCKICGKTWVSHLNEVYYGLKTNRRKISIALEMLAFHLSIRKIAGLISVSPTTVQRWKKKVQNNIY